MFSLSADLRHVLFGRPGVLLLSAVQFKLFWVVHLLSLYTHALAIFFRFFIFGGCGILVGRHICAACSDEDLFLHDFAWL